MTKEERAQVAQNMYIAREILWRSALECVLVIIPIMAIIVLLAIFGQIFVFTYHWGKFIIGLLILCGIIAAALFVIRFGAVNERNTRRAETFLNLDINMDGKIANTPVTVIPQNLGPANSERGVYLGETEAPKEE